MPISIFKRGAKELVDISEVFNIWNLLRARYFSAETIRMFQNFVHDRDFSLVLDTLLVHYDKQAQILEKEAETLKLEVLERPPMDYITSAQVNIITDRYIFRVVYNGVVAQLFSLMSAIRSTTTNDRLRKVIADDLKQHVKDFGKLYKYGKLKGWQFDPPAYKTPKPVTSEALSVVEAFHIWDNLTHRYQQIRLTMFFQGLAHDKEFGALLAIGLKNLQEQVKSLEKEAAKNEVALTKRPPASVSVASDPETMNDDFMYSMIMKGIQDTLDMHVRALIDTIRNDPLRELFLAYWEDELVLYDKFIKYGKAKGWLMPPPVNQAL